MEGGTARAAGRQDEGLCGSELRRQVGRPAVRPRETVGLTGRGRRRDREALDRQTVACGSA